MDFAEFAHLPLLPARRELYPRAQPEGRVLGVVCAGQVKVQLLCLYVPAFVVGGCDATVLADDG